MMSKKYIAVVVLAVLGLAALFWSRQRTLPPQWHESEGVVWTTDYHIAYLGQDDLSDSIQAVLQLLDRSASVYNKSSLVARFNAGTSTQVDAILDTLYRASMAVHRATEGAFDPTVMPLVNAWGFGYKNGVLPTQTQVDSILQFVGLEKVKLAEGKFVKSDPRVQLDFSSIAKGLACDEVGRMLQRNGISCYMVEIGGEIACSGTNREGNAWRVSVDMPTDQPDTVSHEAMLVLALNEGGVATSGSYRKYRDTGGERISHIVNPKTGRSEASDLVSVTVVASSCMLADAWATACMVMGTEAVQRMMQGRDDLGVMTISDIDDQLVVWSNARFADLVAQ